MRQAISDSEAVELLNESLNALRNLAPDPYAKLQTLCFGEYPNEAGCPCTACKIRRILNREAA